MTLTIRLDPELEARAREEAARHGIDVDAWVSGMVEQRLRQIGKGPPSMSSAESRLLQQINRGPSPEEWQRFRELEAKRRSETLAPDEQRELVAICHQMEVADAERLGHLIELAKLRGASLLSLMDELGIHPPPVE